MSTEIYYFSGTGNSLFVARELQERIPDACLIPIVSLLQGDAIKANGESIGFVFPVHALTIPIAVKHFLKKIDLGSAEYIFSIATRGAGTVFRGFKKMDRILKRKKQHLDAHFIIDMGHNEAPRREGYKVPSESDILMMEKVALEKLDLIKDVITTKSTSRERDTDYTLESASNPLLAYLVETTVLLAMDISEHIGGVNYFYHDEKCNGCGICEKVCLSRKLKMVDGKPLWQKKVLCYMCFACLNFCPQEAVQIADIPSVKSYTSVNGRYPHPYATVKDIYSQKEYDHISP